MDTDRLRHSWAQVAAHGTVVPQVFYARIFIAHPELRELFPVSMAVQSDRFVTALGSLTANVANLAGITPFVQRLGRDHRRFGVRSEHYPPVGEALLATLAHFLGDEWTDPLAEDWTKAFTIVTDVMTGAAVEEEAISPP
jgi:hemoglobin-like flavoprotein